ncbi:hypothetical protein QLQ15_17820 [Lysobacter sp. LF1]|uniref:Uncharacterized protein n=1 Tax=Lysobacter stagni TaxID=3045172 RepID=A0ABT6XKR9_9GAMM|nr:hypothetical protein [Lysobacter sp. LF1]MDI9240765.1 hypothetical protein [Lysobacter sp. LF1]
MSSEHSQELFVPIALRFHIESALWRTLIRTHPDPKAFHDAWLRQLPSLLEHADKFRGLSLGTTESDVRNAIAAMTSEIAAAVSNQKALALCDEPTAPAD